MTLRESWRKNLRGHIVPICTTFNEDYSLNTEGFRHHVHLIEEGQHSLDGAARDENTRLKATLKYASKLFDRVHPSGETDFDTGGNVEIPVSGGKFIVEYSSGAMASPALRFALDTA